VILFRAVAGFARFWYGFIAGDQPLIAIAVAAALSATVLLSRVHSPAWWPLPAAVVLVLVVNAVLAARSRAA